jgi:hypothetical protein
MRLTDRLNPRNIKQDAFVFTKRKVFNFAVSILKLVEAEGVEPF